MHFVLLSRIGNVLFLVSHTGMATGIRTASFLTSWSRCRRIEIIPFEPDQRSYLRREAPSVLHHFLTVLSLMRGDQCKITDPFLFASRVDKVGVQAGGFFKDDALIFPIIAFYSNSTVLGISSKILPRVSSQ